MLLRLSENKSTFLRYNLNESLKSLRNNRRWFGSLKVSVNASNPGVKLLNGAVHCIEIMNVSQSTETTSVLEKVEISFAGEA